MIRRAAIEALIAFLALAAPGLAIAPAAAEEITFAFSGTIDNILPRGTLPESITEGDLLTGRFTFDSEAQGMFGGPGTTAYFAVCRIEAAVEEFVYNGDEDPEGSIGPILVRDEAEGAERDGYSAQIFSIGEIRHFLMTLLALPGTNGIVGTALPTTPPDLVPFATGTRTLLVSLTEDFGFAQMSVGDSENVLELTLAEDPLPCPEPALGVSIATCALALGIAADRRRRLRPAA